MQQTLGETLKKLRKTEGITQKQLAHIVGVSVQTIWRYEKESRYPSGNTLQKLEKLFGPAMWQEQFSNTPPPQTGLLEWLSKADSETFQRVELLLKIAGLYDG